RAPEVGERPGMQDVLEARRGTGDRARIADVHTNRYLLPQAAADETPLTEDELMAHADQLDQRLDEIRARQEGIDHQLNNKGQKIDRPSWAVGYTDDQLAEIARQHGVSAYTPGWADQVGLEAGSGEVRENVGESNIQRGAQERQPTPAELRAERNGLEQEKQDI